MARSWSRSGGSDENTPPITIDGALVPAKRVEQLRKRADAYLRIRQHGNRWWRHSRALTRLQRSAAKLLNAAESPEILSVDAIKKGTVVVVPSETIDDVRRTLQATDSPAHRREYLLVRAIGNGLSRLGIATAFSSGLAFFVSLALKDVGGTSTNAFQQLLIDAGQAIRAGSLTTALMAPILVPGGLMVLYAGQRVLDDISGTTWNMDLGTRSRRLTRETAAHSLKLAPLFASRSSGAEITINLPPPPAVEQPAPEPPRIQTRHIAVRDVHFDALLANVESRTAFDLPRLQDLLNETLVSRGMRRIKLDDHGDRGKTLPASWRASAQALRSEVFGNRATRPLALSSDIIELQTRIEKAGKNATQADRAALRNARGRRHESLRLLGLAELLDPPPGPDSPLIACILKRRRSSTDARLLEGLGLVGVWRNAERVKNLEWSERIALRDVGRSHAIRATMASFAMAAFESMSSRPANNDLTDFIPMLPPVLRSAEDADRVIGMRAVTDQLHAWSHAR